MACRYYDDLIAAKIKKWIPDSSTLRVLKPDESKRLFELTANDNNDEAFKLPLIAISRNNDIELLLNIKNPKSYDGIKLMQTPTETMQFNVIPIKLQYQIDIYTKKYEECDEYIRSLLFKLINNPKLMIQIPYNNTYIEHVAHLRVLDTVSDTSSISERIFSGQFTRFTIQLEIQDAFLFSIPYRRNWVLCVDPNDFVSDLDKSCLDDLPNVSPEPLVIPVKPGELELSENINEIGEKELLNHFDIRKI